VVKKPPDWVVFLVSAFRKRKNGTHVHRRRIRDEMDGDDFRVCDERNDGQRDEDPA
jgi:hypothetical protein